MKILICIIIIIVLLFINYYVSSTLLNGNWISDEDFQKKSGSQVFLNLTKHLYRNAKIIIVNDNDSIVVEGKMLFIGSPQSILFCKKSGLVITSGFEDILPKLLYYKYNINGSLVLYKDKVYGSFVKINDF